MKLVVLVSELRNGGDMKSLEKIFKALGSQTRLRILALLFEEKELIVGDIGEELSMRLPRVSRNLSILENVGLVRSRRRSNRILYSLNRALPQVFHRQLLKLLETGFYPRPEKPKGMGIPYLTDIRASTISHPYLTERPKPLLKRKRKKR